MGGSCEHGDTAVASTDKVYPFFPHERWYRICFTGVKYTLVKYQHIILDGTDTS